MTEKQLKHAFKKANRRVDMALAKYKAAILPLYMYNGTGLIRSVYVTILRPDGSIRDFATDLANVFFRKRGKKFYVKKFPHYEKSGCPYCRHASEGCTGETCKFSKYRDACFDYDNLRKLEIEIDDACDERERLLGELESLGVEVWKDDSLW